MIQSINQLRNINISYEQLEGIYFNMEEPFLLSVEWQGINYEFIIRMKLQSKKLIILGSGAS
ncbi:glycosyl transferase family 2, partial [Bacillus cereus]|nr:glycosyl transferase family 2 [Bacillus cereus]